MGALESAFEDYFETSKSRDFTSLMADLKRETTWKTAPRANLLSQYAPLFSVLAEICPCGVLPPKRTAMALLACNRRKPINFSGQSDVPWVEDMSGVIRACFAKYRDLATSPDAARRCLNKASTADKMSIEGVLAKLGSTRLAHGCDISMGGAGKEKPVESGTVCKSLDEFGAFFAAVVKDLDHLDVLATPRSTTSACSTQLYSPRDDTSVANLFMTT